MLTVHLYDMLVLLQVLLQVLQVFCYILLIAHRKKYTVSQKKQHTKLLSTTSSNINRFSYFHWWTGLGSKFATNSCLNIPPRLKHVATLPCEIWMSEKWHQSEICIVINDKSQGSIAKHSRCDKLIYYTFIIQSAGVSFMRKHDYHIFRILTHFSAYFSKVHVDYFFA